MIARTRARAIAVVACSLLAAAVRLPRLGAPGLAEAEQAAFVETHGFPAHAALPVATPFTVDALPRRSGLLDAARHASVPPLHAVGLALWTRAAGTSEVALRLPSALAGTLAAALAALVAGWIAGTAAAAWAGTFVALSPIFTLASREAVPEAPLVLLLLLALALFVRVSQSGGHGTAVSLGLGLGLLASAGIAAFAAVAVVPLFSLAFRPDRRAAAARVATAALAAVTALALLGLARSPLDFGEIPTWIPAATASGIVRCTGASFTRVAGLEYHLAVSHARYVVPLTALVVGLMAWGARRLPGWARGPLAAGAVLPFALGAVLALATGRVLPLQATRLVAALPFVALLVGAGLGSLRGWRAAVSGAAVGGALVAFLALALARHDYETSPTRAVAREVAGCSTPGAVVALRRPLDLLALAAWDVRGPFVLRHSRDPVPEGPAIVVGPSSTCVAGGATCAAFPPCGATSARR
jgi:4-amino-4-deoxy-L-arabinose transferase-like glycosyltransferase